MQFVFPEIRQGAILLPVLCEHRDGYDQDRWLSRRVSVIDNDTLT